MRLTYALVHNLHNLNIFLYGISYTMKKSIKLGRNQVETSETGRYEGAEAAEERIFLKIYRKQHNSCNL